MSSGSVIPDPVAPGQESVWDYPESPALMRSDEWVQIIFVETEICETETSWRLLLRGHPPAYFLPRSAFLAGVLRETDQREIHPSLGEARRLDVLCGESVAPAAGWYYPRPGPMLIELGQHVAVAADAMDACLVDGEKVIPQPGRLGGWITDAIAGPFLGA